MTLGSLVKIHSAVITHQLSMQFSVQNQYYWHLTLLPTLKSTLNMEILHSIERLISN
jgi:hypothetical protein